jgi:hypothetical protein
MLSLMMKRSLKKNRSFIYELVRFRGRISLHRLTFVADGAIRIADAEAQRQKHVDLLEYEHWPVLCTATKGSWYVGYRKKGQRFVDFGVDVSDKTKQGRIYIFD